MRRFLSIAIVVCAVGGALFARPEAQSRASQEKEQKYIDLKADLTGPVAPGDSVVFLVGNFAAQHNGAVITCDSAVRYSDMRIEFFGNVLINKNTTYIYGDRAEYDGDLNEARVYSDIIKVVDGDATLYTYYFVFNTKTNVGTFGRGGVLFNRDNLVEADHGYYYADAKELICVDDVQMRNDEYQMKGDSVIYNLETDHAYYFDHTNIWNAGGDYLYADRGQYQKTDTLYTVTRNGYILTEKQELWSDSIDYYRGREHAVLRGNLQIDETEHKTLSFGDYGEYWKYPGNAVLTRRPSVVNYDPEQGDSLFMRADSMFLFTILSGMEPEPEAKPDSAAVSEPPAAETQSGTEPQQMTDEEFREQLRKQQDTVSQRTLPDSLAQKEGVSPTGKDEEAETEKPELTPAEQKAKLRDEARKAKAERKAEAAKLRDAKLDSIADRRQARITAKLDAQKAREQRALEARKAKAAARFKIRQARAIRKGRELPDSSAFLKFDSMKTTSVQILDSLFRLSADSLLADSLTLLRTDSLDSISRIDTVRIIRAYHHVRMFRTDFQSVCDSLVAVSRDSTIHLYIDPVLWNEENQITSDVMDIFTKNQQIVRAEFVGQPMMVSQLDTLHYNQVAGKEMEAFFHNNSIYRNDVNGNARTIYYIQEEGDPEVQGMMVIDSGNISFYIDENSKIRTITYRNDVTWTAYPMTKIPPDVEPFLKNFKWQGARRPTRDAVFDRTVRPSERVERSQLPRPDFPIAERLDRDKKRFAEFGWTDRNDLVPTEIDEWMRSLGFPTGQPRKPGARL